MSVNRSLPQHASLLGRIEYGSASAPDANGCILWMRAADRDGYGVTGWEGKQYRVHRAWWGIQNGEPPANLMVCHTCDVRRCRNLDHLFLDTNEGNIADRDAKRRHAFGSRNGSAKVDEETIRRILSVHGTQQEIGARFGLAQSQISAIRRRKHWLHVREL